MLEQWKERLSVIHKPKETYMKKAESEPHFANPVLKRKSLAIEKVSKEVSEILSINSEAKKKARPLTGLRVGPNKWKFMGVQKTD
jgi:hypothetical protein